MKCIDCVKWQGCYMEQWVNYCENFESRITVSSGVPVNATTIIIYLLILVDISIFVVVLI